MAVFIFVLFGLVQSVEAAASLDGWAYSNGLGWISFSSATPGSGGCTGGCNYGVKVSTTTGSSIGTFSGYAWSSNFGWISFQNDTDSNLTSDCGPQATVNLGTGSPTSGQVTGWARVISEKGRNDGWDGCIKLSDPSTFASPNNNHVLFPTVTTDGGVTFGVDPALTFNYKKFSGFSWGSMNVGWLMFKMILCPDCIGTPQTQTAQCTASGAGTLASPVSVGSPVTYTVTPTGTGWVSPLSYAWTGSGVSCTGTSCTVSAVNNLQPVVTVNDSATPTGNSASPTCPIIYAEDCTGDGCDATVTCDISGTIPGVSQTYLAGSTGLTPPLTYAWLPENGSDQTATYNYSQAPVTPSVKARGSNGETSYYQCPEYPTSQQSELSCDTFTANPEEIVNGGGDTVLSWSASNATGGCKIEPPIQSDFSLPSVGITGPIHLTTGTIFTLTCKDNSATPATCTRNVNVTVQPPSGGESDPIKLMIKRSSASSLWQPDKNDFDDTPNPPETYYTMDNKSDKVFRGQSFKLQANINPENVFDQCSYTVTPDSPFNDEWDPWTARTDTSTFADPQLLTTDSITPLGQYIFEVICTKDDGEGAVIEESSRAKLNVRRSSIQEF